MGGHVIPNNDKHFCCFLDYSEICELKKVNSLTMWIQLTRLYIKVALIGPQQFNVIAYEDIFTKVVLNDC